MMTTKKRFVRFYFVSCALLISIFIYLFLSDMFRHIFTVLLLVCAIILLMVPNAREDIIKVGEEIVLVIFDR